MIGLWLVMHLWLVLGAIVAVRFWGGVYVSDQWADVLSFDGEVQAL